MAGIVATTTTTETGTGTGEADTAVIERASARKMPQTRTCSALVAALVVTGPAPGAAVIPYKGTTVSFAVADSAISQFTLNAYAFCMSGTKSTHEIKVMVLDAQGKLGSDGQFALAYDKEGTRVSVTGRVDGSTADGTFEVHYNTSLMSFDPLTHRTKFDVATCSDKSKWTAQRVGTADKAGG
jgi:hypothetical protein